MEGKYLKAISQILKRLRRYNPPTQPKLAVPLSISIYLLEAAAMQGAKEQAIDDFAVIAFYFFLHVGEYTYHKPLEHRHTQ